MKKTQKIQFRFLLKMACILCLIFFNLSCGLDVIEYYEPPIQGFTPQYEKIDLTERYLTFWTNNSENTSSSFKGTNVFYKIYNSSSDVESDRSKLITLSENDYTSSIVETMEKTYGYSKLNNSHNLFPKTGLTNYEVRIDFTDTDGNYTITYNGNNLTPLRVITDSNNGNVPFLFNFDSSYWQYNSERDTDIKYNSNSTEDKWYVQFFAASVGLSNTYTEQYSNIVYLGCVAFDK